MKAQFQSIQPLWESFPTRQVQETDKTPAGSVFGEIFKSAIENVRTAEDVVAKAEYQLSTGTLDNPAQLSLELYRANTAMTLLVQLRQKALDAYSELSRLSI
ncbi:MAG: flagellar hook-basal body complex protein FliE [Oscillospiraceae bacterium]|nr:flagellar hook-basal body complex protein FliE [Oscillospiraceae bacterium]